MRDVAMVINRYNENLTTKETIEVIKEAGYRDVFVQWYDKDWVYSKQEELEYIKGKDLNIIFAHLGFKGINNIWESGIEGDLLVDKYINNIDECKQNNIPMVIIHLTEDLKEPFLSEIGLNRIRKIVDHAEMNNIKVAFENIKIKGCLEYVLNNIKNSNVGICYDSGHCHAFFNDEFDFDFFKDRIFAVHLHDNDKSDDAHLLPFDGTIDWEMVITKLKENNYQGPVTLELCYRDIYFYLTPLEFYKKGYQIGEKLRDMFND